MAKQIYLAGPFFNEAQIEWMTKLESKCDELRIPRFSPRLQGYCTEDDSSPLSVKAPLIFKADWSNIMCSDLLLANIDWNLPEGQTLMIGESSFDKHQNICSLPHGIKPIDFPDSGTVWEIGFAWTKGIPVIAYSTKPLRLVNIMITESVVRTLIGEKEIFNFLNEWKAADFTTEEKQKQWIADYRKPWEGDFE